MSQAEDLAPSLPRCLASCCAALQQLLAGTSQAAAPSPNPTAPQAMHTLSLALALQDVAAACSASACGFVVGQAVLAALREMQNSPDMHEVMLSP